MPRDTESGDTVIHTERLLLDPLTVQAAAEMVGVLDDPALYTYIGGRPPGLAELTRRYERQQVGHSGDGSEAWRNWVVRLRSDGAAVGYVQATLPAGSELAEVAWVIGTPWQGRGYAREAAAGMVERLVADGVTGLVAHIHPDHRASAAVAGALGLSRTGRTVDGEEEWAGGRP
jgi:RimJ/RimL family protein N-acetyltransferase